MNLLFSCIGKRGYICDYFRPHLQPGDRIIGTSNTPWTPGFKSADKGIVLPSYKTNEYKTAFMDVCRQEKIDAILSFRDDDVAILATFEAELKALGAIPILPNLKVAELCLDKWETYKFLERNNLPTALSFVSYHEACTALHQGRISFPLVVKPRYGFGSENTWQARNLKELDVFFHYTSDMLIQQLLIGETYNLDILNTLDCRTCSVVAWQKFLSRLGETEQASTVAFPELLEYGYMLGDLVGHVGPMDVDLFVQKDKIFLLEMNPRFGGGYPVSHLAGADFPLLILKMLRGERVSMRSAPYVPNICMLKEILPFGCAEPALFKDVLCVDESIKAETAAK
jgi:carbamoyl-phosphate synthase large subunit